MSNEPGAGYISPIAVLWRRLRESWDPAPVHITVKLEVPHVDAALDQFIEGYRQAEADE